MVRLGNIGTWTRGSGIKRSETVPQGKPCIRYGEIYTSYNVVLDKPKSFVPSEIYEKSVHIKHNDLVLTLTGENTEEIGKALAYLGNEEIAAGGDLVVWSNHGCDPLYLAYLMYSPELLKAKAAASNGNIIVHASVKKLSNITISLPPLPVQREIVARLERELAEADSLAANFKRIAELADAEFKAELDETFQSINATRVRLGDIGNIAMCKRVLKSQTSETGDIPFYKIGTFGKQANAYISKELFEDYSTNYSYPDKGDILISAAGTIGRTVVFDGSPSFFQDSNIVWLKHDQTRLDNSYLQFFYQLKPWAVSVGVTIPRIYNGDIESTQIPLPSLAEQRAIVGKLNTARLHAQQLKASAEKGLHAAENLRTTILSEAFTQ